MIISLVRLPEDGRRFEHQYDVDGLDLSGEDFALSVPPLVKGRVDRTGVDVRVRGNLNAQINAPCDRCLENVDIPVDREFDLYYTRSDEETGDDTEKELQLKDLDFAFLEGEEIDLDELVHEQLALALPVRVLCAEDCRGLCPQCGIDRNRESCSCQPPMDPRWQTLADLSEETKKRDN
jgi:uncharacterized protein